MRFDALGLTLSGLCLIHCVAIPVAALSAPTLLGLLAGEDTLTHIALLALALPIGGFAFFSSWRRHRSSDTLIIGIVGLVVMALGVSHVFGHDNEIILTITGVLTVGCAHGINLIRGHRGSDGNGDGSYDGGRTIRNRITEVTEN